MTKWKIIPRSNFEIKQRIKTNHNKGDQKWNFTNDTDGMADEFEKWVNKNHPEIETTIEIDGPGTTLLDDDGNFVDHQFWEDFCND